ncbi:MAG: hypothetical protein Q9196_004572, partial [Gyalolechia fulgens]
MAAFQDVAFPGPKSAAATPIPYVRKLVKGDLVPWVMALHAKYGEVVRVTPDELSFISPSAWQDIYTTRPQLPKPEKGVFKASNGVPTIASTTVTEDHTRQRRVLSHAFSERALRAQEDILQRYTDLLVAKLHEVISRAEVASVTLDMSKCDKAKRHFMFSREKIARRIETKTNRPDFMTYILGNNEGEAKMGRDEIDATGAFLILAGSETSATTCSASTYFFLKNPSVYKRLQAEIRNAFPSMSEITTPAVNKLPYLHAVITEALRMHPAAAVSVPRIVDRPGVVVSGHEIPVGTRCGIPQKTMFRSPSNFVEPNTYCPERWLPEADSKYDADRKEAHEPFMVGPRNCIGKT